MKLTVLICVHSTTEKNDLWLREALVSLKQQTYQNFDTIIVLDECWENTKKMLEKQNPIVDTLVLERKNKEGLALAKNYGLSFVKTDWVAFLDADDLYEPKKLEKQVRYIESNNVDFLGTHAWNINSFDRITKTPSCFFEYSYNIHEDIVNRLPYENVLTHGSMMIRMECLRQLNFYRNEKGTEDYDLWKRAAEKGYKFFQLPERLYVFSVGTSVQR